MRPALLFVLLLTSTVAFATQTIQGRVVANEGALTCLNGYAYGSMIVKVKSPKKLAARFVLVEFSYPCNERPLLLESGLMQKLRLIRRRERDRKLLEFLDCADNSIEPICSCLSAPRWTRTPGFESEVLPFGQVVPCYESADFRVRPVV